MKQLVFWLLLLVSTFSQAQMLKPVSWSYSSKNTGSNELDLIFTAKINSGWHIYSHYIKEGGPVPTSININKSDSYEVVGKLKEISKPTKMFEEVFNMEIAYFANKAVFVQKIKLKKPQATVKGSIEFMCCNDGSCLPPDNIEFSMEVKSSDVSTSATDNNTKSATTVVAKIADTAQNTLVAKTNDSLKATAQLQQPQAEVNTSTTNADSSPTSLWAIFFAGFLGGFAALLMPCIFPMLPLTVSYFTKSSGHKRQGIAKALVYALSIIVIYVLIGLAVSITFGADALNNLSTNGVFNFLFFILLVVFAASFLGAFEITLPASWVNKADSQSGKGGLAGIFFMAATLALVSFSCTGPIIGTLLVQAATMGQYMGPAIGMFGFALALSIPFALFAMFPSWLKSMPKSGGWLNSVKVVLGFLELALAFKFLSNVDLAYHWDWFDREVYLALWIIIFGLLGLYLLGKIKLAHDSEFKGLSAFRLSLAIVVLSFTMYMIPGLWGAPLRAIAAFLPPQTTQDFDLYTSSLNQPKTDRTTHKYADKFQAPLNLNAFFDYDEGLAYAQKVQKPVIIDFTGHACVNCRKMEADVWSTREVLSKLANDYVLIQLYVDDKTELPEKEQYISKFSGKNIKTIGNKWSDLQASLYNANSQPYYVLLDNKGKLLVKPQGAEYNAMKFLQFLDTGVSIFQKGS
jgi:thiol:disulfide interchange protein DsbD